MAQKMDKRDRAEDPFGSAKPPAPPPEPPANDSEERAFLSLIKSVAARLDTEPVSA
jgi:hypothetical protein